MDGEKKGEEQASTDNNRTHPANGRSGVERRPIFRYEAIRHYLEGREKDVLPRYVSPRIFLALWTLLLLVVVGVGSAGYLAKVPDYASGPAVVLDERSAARYGNGAMVAAFLPSKDLADLKKGQRLLLRLDPGDEESSRPVAFVESDVVSPETVRERFGLESAAVVNGRPSAVVVAPLGSLKRGVQVSTRADAVYRADIEVGSRAALSLFPVVGKLAER